MQLFWRIVNFSLVGLGIVGGYTSLAPEALHQTDVDAIPCLIILIVMPLFALRTVSFSIGRSKVDVLPRPSMDRHAFNWGCDPLQSLFLSTLMSAGFVVGSACRLPIAGMPGFWMFAVYFSSLVGLLIGQWLVYKVYRRNIVDKGCVCPPNNTQNRGLRSWFPPILWSVVFFAISIVLPTMPSFEMRIGGHLNVITRQHNPEVYWGTEGVTILVAVSFLLFGLYRIRKENTR